MVAVKNRCKFLSQQPTVVAVLMLAIENKVWIERKELNICQEKKKFVQSTTGTSGFSNGCWI